MNGTVRLDGEGAVSIRVRGRYGSTWGEQTATAQAPGEQGTAVANPADSPGLVSDCAILLAAKDTLRGTETLNWSADTAIDDWEGITVSEDTRTREGAASVPAARKPWSIRNWEFAVWLTAALIQRTALAPPVEGASAACESASGVLVAPQSPPRRWRLPTSWIA